MKAIVGLGNPGAEYQGTRHNIGFEVIDELARRWNAHLKSWRSLARVARAVDHDAVLVKPTTFMNLSGQAVGSIAGFYQVGPEDVLVIVDEVQLPLGRLRLRRSGSAGGHNGLKSVIAHIGADFPRLRIGVDRGEQGSNLSNRVLSPFPSSERPIVQEAVQRAADAVEMFVNDGLQTAMNRFNVAGDSVQSEI
jgi:PTH1 family peptidyl-tRNA hydrolase